METLECGSNVIGQFLVIVGPKEGGRKPVTFCEIEVWGTVGCIACPQGTFSSEGATVRPLTPLSNPLNSLCGCTVRAGLPHMICC
eukprot:COSAG05_NODE_16782_length_339_cov_0.645833_1_plen_84_part_01